MVGVGIMRLLVLLLVAGAEEAVRDSPAVRALDPLIVGAELEFGELRLSCDEIDRRQLDSACRRR
ncbi:hypothetical protein ACVOMV_32030 [Mesorhizobium atlanticum]